MSRYDEWASHLDPDMPDGALNEEEYEALDRISEVLSEEALWDAPPADLRDRLLASARAESLRDEGGDELIADQVVGIDEHRSVGADQPETSGGGGGADSGDEATVVPLDRGRRSRRARWLVPAMTAAAAVIAVIAFVNWPQSDPATFDLAGTELNPNATATVEVEPLGAGVAITLNITGLPPAGEGEYYSGWLSGEIGSVPVGSFHWREGGIPIELWSGVDVERYPTLGITLQQEGEPTTSSGVVVLKGRLIDE